jgi:hypothetical protein
MRLAPYTLGRKKISAVTQEDYPRFSMLHKPNICMPGSATSGILGLAGAEHVSELR